MTDFKVIFKNTKNETIEEQGIKARNIADLTEKADKEAAKLLIKNATIFWDAYALITKGNISR